MCQKERKGGELEEHRLTLRILKRKVLETYLFLQDLGLKCQGYNQKIEMNDIISEETKKTEKIQVKYMIFQANRILREEEENMETRGLERESKKE